MYIRVNSRDNVAIIVSPEVSRRAPRWPAG